MVKKKTAVGGGFDFDDFIKDEGLQNAKSLAKQQANYRSL
jgi:hypothetical protein